MKLAVKALVLGMFAVGCSAAVFSSHAHAFVASHQVTSSAYPPPMCSPHHCTVGQ